MKKDKEFTQIYDKIQELLKNGKNNISVLEEQVDVKLQMEYFNISKKLYKDLNKEAIIEEKGDLLDDDVTIERKKELLSSLAKVDNPVAFRALEAYRQNPDEELEQWSKLAYQESKMVLETSLLGEAPIFISTGLGGQGSKLRYFIVLAANKGIEMVEWQTNLVKKELEFVFGKSEGVVEEIELETDMIMLTALLPIATNIKDILAKVVNECNEMGNFLKDSFIVTNVKKLEVSEIRQMIKDSYEKEKQAEGSGNDDVIEDMLS